VVTTVINGRRTIKATNRQESVEIADGGEDGITVSITRKADAAKDGGEKAEKTETYKAKDAKELAAKHPEAFKVYEKYGGALKIAVATPARIVGNVPRAPEPATAPELNHVDVPQLRIEVPPR
jgi:hypothetical protein